MRVLDLYVVCSRGEESPSKGLVDFQRLKVSSFAKVEVINIDYLIFVDTPIISLMVEQFLHCHI